jgi:hypothetical protein
MDRRLFRHHPNLGELHDVNWAEESSDKQYMTFEDQSVPGRSVVHNSRLPAVLSVS